MQKVIIFQYTILFKGFNRILSQFERSSINDFSKRKKKSVFRSMQLFHYEPNLNPERDFGTCGKTERRKGKKILEKKPSEDFSIIVLSIQNQICPFSSLHHDLIPISYDGIKWLVQIFRGFYNGDRQMIPIHHSAVSSCRHGKPPSLNTTSSYAMYSMKCPNDCSPHCFSIPFNQAMAIGSFANRLSVGPIRLAPHYNFCLFSFVLVQFICGVFHNFFLCSS